MENNRVDYSHKVLEVENLKKHFYHGVGRNKLVIPAVDGLTFDVYKREVFGLVGESGCGKTTTGRTIIKLYNPTEGVVSLNGEMIGAGYKEHIREIKRIKEEAAEKILKFDNQKYQASLINNKANQTIGFLKLDIRNINLGEKGQLKIANRPIEANKEQVYQVKNDYEFNIETIKYDYNLEASKVHNLSINSAQADYDRELAGLKIGKNRKTDGLKESAALNEDVIEARISELNANYEKLFADLSSKYAPLIEKGDKNIIAKEDAKARIAVIKEARHKKVLIAKENYKKAKAAIVKPDKVAVRAAVNKVKTDNKIKITEMRKQISELQAKAKQEISVLPSNKETGINEAEVKVAIEEIKAWRDQAVNEKKAIIAELRQINKSKDALEYSRKMQMIFQDPISSLNPRMTVLEIIGEGLTIQGGFTKAQIKATVQETLEIVGLSKEYAARYPHEFSGGQRQRIGVARALIMNPDFIIADEPISSLDVSIRAQVINLLSDLKEKLGLTILFIAHDLSVVRFFCDRIAVMYNGKIVELAEAEELFNNPMHAYTKSLLSSVPQPDPDYEKNRTRIGYNPRAHDYRMDKPSLREIGPDHFIYANDKEFAEAKKAYDDNSGKKAVKKGDSK
ncbi:Oligopeptide transport ATP-binding protein OppF [Candidatus Izimaplasma bacterium HR1]|jgi:oligopeptide transport system ATP-binding protein|uniref:ATP-binding cassette domain-containing protein n=1 Tax=Candidatus Izimoplasma sp. HR1 TaxID=1541959 RepID=UPI0004F810E5|nr:Oligopeptide transport ATP-binding protein OppF [Candidatus Izimaplasma bacterium HR1]